MRKHTFSPYVLLLPALLYLVFSCATDNLTSPDDPSNTRITLGLKSPSLRTITDGSLTDTAGRTVRMGTATILSGNIDSVRISVFSQTSGTFKYISLKGFDMLKIQDTAWCTYVWSDTGRTTVIADAFLKNNKTFSDTLSVTLFPINTTLIDDFESGTKVNRFGYWWLFYDDSADYKGPNSKVTNAVKDTNLIYIVKPVTSEGNNGSSCIRMDYQLGPGKVNGATGYAYVGVATDLAAVGNTCDITGATKITFYARATPSITLKVQVRTTDVKDFCYYYTLITVGTLWQQYAVTLTQGVGIIQATWAAKVDFNPKNVERIQWQIDTEQFPGVQLPITGTVWLDDVVIEGYTRKPH